MAFSGPVATTSTYGVVQVGNNMSVTNGIISAAIPIGYTGSQGTIGYTGSSGASSGSTSGTWTPIFVSSLGGTITITIATANYVKTGQQVTCYFDFTEATEVGGGVAGLMSINGLPFISVAGTGIVGTMMINYFEQLNTNETFITGTVAGASTQVLLWATHQVATSTRLTQNDVKPTTRLVGTVTYQSAA